MKFIVVKPVEEFFLKRGECFETIFNNSVTIECRSLVSNSRYKIHKAFIERCIEEKSIIIYKKDDLKNNFKDPKLQVSRVFPPVFKVSTYATINLEDIAKRQYDIMEQLPTKLVDELILQEDKSSIKHIFKKVFGKKRNEKNNRV